MQYYDELARIERDGFEIVIDKTWEDLNPRDCFDDCVTDIDKLCKDIESGKLDWFMMRVRVFAEGLELSDSYVGGCLYEDAREALTDGLAEDLIFEALVEAKRRVYSVYKKFAELNERVEREGVEA